MLNAAVSELCQIPPQKPWGNTVIYGDTSTHIHVAEVVESEVRWWDSVCVSTREGIQFPSVLLQPLGLGRPSVFLPPCPIPAGRGIKAAGATGAMRRGSHGTAEGYPAEHRSIPPTGGCTWWAHFAFTRINIARTILPKRSRICVRRGACRCPSEVAQPAVGKCGARRR
jgi:hypothetical protein